LKNRLLSLTTDGSRALPASSYPRPRNLTRKVRAPLPPAFEGLLIRLPETCPERLAVDYPVHFLSTILTQVGCNGLEAGLEFAVPEQRTRVKVTGRVSRKRPIIQTGGRSGLGRSRAWPSLALPRDADPRLVPYTWRT